MRLDAAEVEMMEELGGREETRGNEEEEAETEEEEEEEEEERETTGVRMEVERETAEVGKVLER